MRIRQILKSLEENIVFLTSWLLIYKSFFILWLESYWMFSFAFTNCYAISYFSYYSYKILFVMPMCFLSFAMLRFP